MAAIECPNESSLSWWEKDFNRNKVAAQARMRLDALPVPVQAYFDAQLKQEEAENLCRKGRTHSRTPLASITGDSIQSTVRVAYLGTGNDG